MTASTLASGLPETLDGARLSGPVRQRYEDVTQEGRLTLVSLPHALGELVWPAVMTNPEMGALARDGVVPILTRLVLTGGDGPISSVRPLTGDAAWSWATSRGPDGAVHRLLLLMEVRLSARAGLTLAPLAPDAPVVHAGSVFAEHAATRLFAPPGARRVLDLCGRVPESSWEERRFDAVAPEPETPVARHQVPLRFGVMHTDPNNHVNSLVYPRVFEEAAMVLRGEIDAARALEVVWRKPIFAGERIVLDQWLNADGEVHGAFLDDTGSARCRLSMRFGP